MLFTRTIELNRWELGVTLSDCVRLCLNVTSVTNTVALCMQQQWANIYFTISLIKYPIFLGVFLFKNQIRIGSHFHHGSPMLGTPSKPRLAATPWQIHSGNQQWILQPELEHQSDWSNGESIKNTKMWRFQAKFDFWLNQSLSDACPWPLFAGLT